MDKSHKYTVEKSSWVFPWLYWFRSSAIPQGRGKGTFTNLLHEINQWHCSCLFIHMYNNLLHNIYYSVHILLNSVSQKRHFHLNVLYVIMWFCSSRCTVGTWCVSDNCVDWAPAYWSSTDHNALVLMQILIRMDSTQEHRFVSGRQNRFIKHFNSKCSCSEELYLIIDIYTTWGYENVFQNFFCTTTCF